MIQLVRKILYEILVYNRNRGGLGYETKFYFKWIPDLQNTATPLGDQASNMHGKLGAFNRRGIERTALLTLSATGVILGIATWGGIRIMTILWGVTSKYLDWDAMAAPLLSLVQGFKT